MLQAGVLDRPKADAVAMLHVDSRLDVGTVGITAGGVSASTDELRLTVRGRGGHGAYPHTAVDAMPAAAALVLALQNIVARETDPLASAVVTIGTIAGGYRNNVIADCVTLSGTLRAHDETVREELARRVARIGSGIAAAYGVEIELELVPGYPPVINDEPLTRGFAAYLRLEGGLRVEEPPPTMGGEDFAYFAQHVPGVLIRLGVRSEAAQSFHPGHSPLFRIDEAALKYGTQTLVLFALAVTQDAI